MGKKKRGGDHPSLLGKKPGHTAKKKRPSSSSVLGRNPGRIKNRLKRSEMYGKYLQQKRTEKRKRQQRQQQEAATEKLGEDVRKPIPRTIDSTREIEPTAVAPDDPEVAGDEADDEFAPYFSAEDPSRPRVLITTRPRPSQQLFHFIADLQKLIPDLHFYPRRSYSVKEICRFAASRDFTHVCVLSEKNKRPTGLTVSHIGRNGCASGPTAFFKVSSVVCGSGIPGRGRPTSHRAELNVAGFTTRLGRRVGRLLASLFPVCDAQLEGRQVVTFHNQRDHVFVRQHRYAFAAGGDSKDASSAAEQPPVLRTRLQELGPRFTLKLRWLQEGTFDTLAGEYEFYHKRKEMDTSRRKFHL
jgi:ribosome production factor 1